MWTKRQLFSYEILKNQLQVEAKYLHRIYLIINMMLWPIWVVSTPMQVDIIDDVISFQTQTA